jgi:glucose-6-phosphate-specific signal transduction histidine kinase
MLRHRLPAAHEEALYRLVQETLANVVRQAGATHAAVRLVWDTTVRLTVEDDGTRIGATAAGLTYGLDGMGERIAALGGRLQVDNRPGGGARVVAEFPLPTGPERRWPGQRQAMVDVGSEGQAPERMSTGRAGTAEDVDVAARC